jgi:hypothetical protein
MKGTRGIELCYPDSLQYSPRINNFNTQVKLTPTSTDVRDTQTMNLNLLCNSNPVALAFLLCPGSSGPSPRGSETPLLGRITRLNEKDMVLDVDTTAGTYARSTMGPITEWHAVRDIVPFKSWAFCSFDVVFESWRDGIPMPAFLQNATRSDSLRNGIDTCFCHKLNANV